MSLSKSKCLYSNNCLQFLKRTVPLKVTFWREQSRSVNRGPNFRILPFFDSLNVNLKNKSLWELQKNVENSSQCLTLIGSACEHLVSRNH